MLLQNSPVITSLTPTGSSDNNTNRDEHPVVEPRYPARVRKQPDRLGF